VGYIDISFILGCKTVIQKFTSISDELWIKYSKHVNITKYSKAWWNEEYSRDLYTYHISRSRSDWSKFKEMVKKTKRIFFDEKISLCTSAYLIL